VTENTPRS